MPTELDIKLIPKVLQLVRRYGVAVTLTSVAAAYDVATGTTTDTETSQSAYVTPPEPYTQKEVDDEMILVGDLSTYMAAKDLTSAPAVGSKVTFSGRVYRVVWVSPIYTGEQVALYGLQLR